MTTIAFTPSTTAAPPFQAVVILDGNLYALATMWNFVSCDETTQGRWYVSLTDQGGALICNQPLIESPPGGSIPLFPGNFTTSTIIYQQSAFVITP